MDAIASSVIGGTLLTGGVGNVFGTLFGVLIKATIEAFITFQGTYLPGGHVLPLQLCYASSLYSSLFLP